MSLTKSEWRNMMRDLFDASDTYREMNCYHNGDIVIQLYTLVAAYPQYVTQYFKDSVLKAGSRIITSAFSASLDELGVELSRLYKLIENIEPSK